MKHLQEEQLNNVIPASHLSSLRKQGPTPTTSERPFVRNDIQTSFLSLRGVPNHRDDAAISTLAIVPFAGMTVEGIIVSLVIKPSIVKKH